ncbi:hypothetical protein QE152_g9829 [Popillia japonica]|uniref:Tc1-like transposase DDE domain-containing protein n=1 Tax=Popillia japonica TaxID=7064 RepID=A0AAW1LYY6_POPJA
MEESLFNKYIGIRKFRAEDRKIYYLDETWVNAGHTKRKMWENTTIINRRQGFVGGLSARLKDPSGKGKSLIILFESKKKTEDYHEDMNSTVFTVWIQNTLPLLKRGCVIVMDNASYHLTKKEKSPTSSWKKNALIEWLLSKGIIVEDKLLKVQLLELVKQYSNSHPVQYIVNETIRESGRTI